MSPITDSRWEGLKERAFAAAEALAVQSAEEQLPVRLSQIAAARMVKDVVFRPLLVDGCLGIRKDGFVIFVRALKERTEQLKKAWRFEDSMCFHLPARVRFTIAHEIAHTFFFEAGTTRPRADIDLDVPQTVKSLEYACNEVAAHMLLPNRLLAIELKKVNILDPDALRAFARRAGVATHVLAIRLKESVDWSGKLGAVLCVKREASGARVISKAMHYSLRPQLGSNREDPLLTELMNDSSFVLNGGDKREVTYPFRCFAGTQRAIQEFVWRCENASPVSGSTYFVTVKRVGDLQLLNPVARDL